MPERRTLTDRQLAQAMKAAREAIGSTQEEAASEFGVVGASRISEWERNENEGEPSKGFKILHYFVALLRSDPGPRDRLLREIGALEEERDPEIERLVRSIFDARENDSDSEWINRREIIERTLRIGRTGRAQERDVVPPADSRGAEAASA